MISEEPPSSSASAPPSSIPSEPSGSGPSEPSGSGASGAPSRDELLDAWQYLIEAHASIERQLSACVQASLGLSLTWTEVLMRLLKAPGHERPTTQLAREVSFSSGGFTRLVDRLVDAGLVSRGAVPHDRRVVVLGLSGEGERVARACADILTRELGPRFGTLGPSGLGPLSEQLRQLSGSL